LFWFCHSFAPSISFSFFFLFDSHQYARYFFCNIPFPPEEESIMTALKTAFAALLVLFLATPVLSQSTNATISGTIQDTTGALVPGVSLTATNTGTGVMTSVLTNDSGTYSFPSLLPGSYKLSAELTGFQSQTYTDVRLGNGEQVRLNFTLKVGGANTAVDVSIQVDTQLAVSSSSVGEVISQQRVVDLPTVTNNVLDLYRLVPGIRLTDESGNNGVVSGLGGLGTVNITRDGVDNTGAARFGVSLGGATYMSPDLIGEVRIIVAPVDAELGRGNGQFQFMTRSGGNQYHGAGVWDSAKFRIGCQHLEQQPASRSENKRLEARATGLDQQSPVHCKHWRPHHQEQNFFLCIVGQHAHELANESESHCADALCTQRNFSATSITGITETTPSSWLPREPLPRLPLSMRLAILSLPATNPDGSPFTGSLHYGSVFGTVLNPTTVNADCSNVQVGPASTPSGSWDVNRTAIDSTGFVTKLMGNMPLPNNYEIGDGLNTAGFRWVRPENSGSEGIFAAGLAFRP
jgi:hypothetical protein